MKISYVSLLFCCLIIEVQNLFAAPVVTQISPTNGDISGGNNVIIIGSGFTGATNVDFGFRPAVGYVVLNDTTIHAVAPVGSVGTFNVTVTASAITSAFSADDYYTYTTTGWRGIVSGTSPNDVALFNTDTETFVTNIVTTSSSLTSIINPAGTFIYTANDIPPCITVIDAATYTIVDAIPLTVGTGSFDMIINPAGTRLYVSNITSGYVTVVDTTNNTVVANIFVLQNLGPISITPDGSTVYVSNFSGGIFAIDTSTNTVTSSIPVGFFPGKIAITPDGTKAFIPISSTNAISVYDLPSWTLTNSIPVISGSYGAFILPNSQALYVVNITSDSLTVVDVPTETVTTTLPLVPPLVDGAGPFWVAGTPDSEKVFIISQFYASVVPIDVATNTVGVPFMNMGGQFQDLVISPDPSPVAAFTAVPQIIGTPTVFDASASLSPIGTIVSYAWNFGDGNTLVTASSVTNHTYTTPGNFNVTLTVTNSAGTSTTQVFSSGFMSNNGGPPATRSRLISGLPPPPTNATGFQKYCRFPSQTNVVNVLEWSPPVGYTPVVYLIFRDAALTQLIRQVPGSGPLKFEDPNRVKKNTYIYYIVSVDTVGNRSPAVTVSVQPKG